MAVPKRKCPRLVATAVVLTGNWRLRASLHARSAMNRRCPITYARNAATMMVKKLWQQLNKRKRNKQDEVCPAYFICPP